MALDETVYDPQLGNVPADQSKIIYLDEAHKLDLPPETFIVVVDRFTRGAKYVQIITADNLDILHKECVERNKRWDTGKGCFNQSDLPFLTSAEKRILVEANKDIIVEDEFGNLATVDGSPFYYELAEKCCERANKFMANKKIGAKND